MFVCFYRFQLAPDQAYGDADQGCTLIIGHAEHHLQITGWTEPPVTSGQTADTVTPQSYLLCTNLVKKKAQQNEAMNQLDS